MRIALDITPIFQDRPTGVSYYCASVIHALVKYESQHEYLLIGVCPRGLQEKIEAQLNQIAPQLKQKILFVPQKIQSSLLSALQMLPLKLVDPLIGAMDIMHQFDAYSFSTNSLATATVFDLSAQKIPASHTKKNASIQTRRLRAIRSRCTHFFSISKTMKSELVKDWQLPKEMVSVVYPPIDNRQTLTDSCVDFACIKKLPGLFSTIQKNNYVLSVATREPRKNLGTLIMAFEQLDAPIKVNHPLVIVGAKGWGSDVVQGTGENIWVTEYVCDTCLDQLYARAHAFVYASRYEGFGMPIAEAMKAGVPVICSNLPIFREVAGDAAMLVDTSSSTILSTAITEMLKMSNHKRDTIIQKGLNQAREFSAKESASVMVSTWVSLVQSGNENRRF